MEDMVGRLSNVLCRKVNLLNTLLSKKRAQRKLSVSALSSTQWMVCVLFSGRGFIAMYVMKLPFWHSSGGWNENCKVNG